MTPALRNADRPPRVALAVALTVVVLASAAVVTVSAHTNEVSADSQVSTNGTVRAETAFVLTDSWLVVHHDADGSIGEPIGHTLVRPGALRTDVGVPINDSVWANWTGARQVHLVLHNDDGDGQFDPAADQILTTGSEPAATELVVAKQPAGAYVSVEQFDAVQTNGSVRVRQVRSPSDGFLVLTGPEGKVVGQAAITAGRTLNTTVNIEETLYRRQPDEFDVTVTLYADDGDGQFGDSDDPVRAGEDAVATTVTLQRTDDRTPTPGTATPAEGNGTDGADGATPDGDGHEHSDGADHEHSDDGHSDSGTADSTATDSQEGGQSTTRPRTPVTDTQEDRGTPTAADGSSTTATDDTGGETPGGGGPGFGVLAVVGSMLVVVWYLARRRE